MDDIDSYELARSTGINPRYCETFRSVIRLFFWNDNQVLRYPVEEGTAIAAVVPGYVCELYDAGGYVQISLFPSADPAAVSWTLVIAGSVKEGAALPDGADVIELEALHRKMCEHLRPVWEARLSPARNEQAPLILAIPRPVLRAAGRHAGDSGTAVLIDRFMPFAGRLPGISA
jgi:hypothetical protein